MSKAKQYAFLNIEYWNSQLLKKTNLCLSWNSQVKLKKLLSSRERKKIAEIHNQVQLNQKFEKIQIVRKNALQKKKSHLTCFA